MEGKIMRRRNVENPITKEIKGFSHCARIDISMEYSNENWSVCVFVESTKLKDFLDIRREEKKNAMKLGIEFGYFVWVNQYLHLK